MFCKFCQYDIPAEDIELSQRLAKCRGCNQVFTIDIPSGPDASPQVTSASLKPGKPEKLTLVDENGQGYMQWRWFHPVAFFLLFFCIAWDSFLIFWYSAALFGMQGNGIPGPFNIIAIVFPIAHVAVGVGLTYFVLCLFFNKTQVVYDGLFVTVRSGPFPTFRKSSFSRDEIQRLESELHKNTGNKSVQFNSQLFAIVSDNSRKPLLAFTADAAMIRYVQWQLETWLGLPPGRSCT